MLNSAEHEIVNDHKYKNLKEFSIPHAQKSCNAIFLLINIEMPTIVGEGKILCSAEMSMDLFL